MKELLEMGGVITWVQAGLLFFAIVMIFERLFFFQTTRLNEGRLLTGIANQLRKRAYAEAIHESSLAAGPMGRILHTITTRHQLDRSELRGVADDAVGLEQPRLEPPCHSRHSVSSPSIRNAWYSARYDGSFHRYQ